MSCQSNNTARSSSPALRRAEVSPPRGPYRTVISTFGVASRKRAKRPGQNGVAVFLGQAESNGSCQGRRPKGQACLLEERHDATSVGQQVQTETRGRDATRSAFKEGASGKLLQGA